MRRNMLIDEEYGYRHFHVVTEASDEELAGWFQSLLPEPYADGILGLLDGEDAAKTLPKLVSFEMIELASYGGEYDYHSWSRRFDTAQSDGIVAHLHESDDSYLRIGEEGYYALNFLNLDVHENCTCIRCREEKEEEMS